MDFLNLEVRRQIITEIKGNENVQRKVVSYKKAQMQNDNFHQYVVEHLESKLDKETVQELNVFSNINLQKRISKSEASIYKHGVVREVYADNKKVEGFDQVFEDMNFTTKMRKANEVYKYQDQCALQIVPAKDGSLQTRVLLPHHYDVVPDPNNSEKALAYIISNFDNTTRDMVGDQATASMQPGFSQGTKYRDQTNQLIADWDDPKLEKERYFVWTEVLNFVMNGKGDILDKDTGDKLLPISDPSDPHVASPLAEYEVLPFVDVTKEKEFEYWVRSGDVLFYATIIYNVILTSEFQVVEMQGHAQPYYKGDAEHMPENIRIGVDKMIFIPVNPNNEVSAEFGFANPGSDLAGVRGFRESWLSAFLSSRGLDISIISGAAGVKGATSGIERLLQMLEKFEASLEDFSTFKDVEYQAFCIIYHWIKALYGERVDGETLLSEVYQLNLPDYDKATFKCEYEKPQLIKTDMEVLDVMEKEIDMRLSSRLHALMEYKGLTIEEAQKRIKEIDQLALHERTANAGTPPADPTKKQTAQNEDGNGKEENQENEDE
jgi:hypothetical protein